MRLCLPIGEIAALRFNFGSNNLLLDHGHTPHVIVFYSDGRYIGDGLSIKLMNLLSYRKSIGEAVDDPKYTSERAVNGNPFASPEAGSGFHHLPCFSKVN